MSKRFFPETNGYSVENPTANLEYTDAELERIEEILFFYVANQFFGEGWEMAQHMLGMVQGMVEMYNINNNSPLDAAYILKHITYLKKIPNRPEAKERTHALLMLGLSKTKIGKHQTVKRHLELEDVFKPPMTGYKDDIALFTRWMITRVKKTGYHITNWRWANVNIDYSIKTIRRKKIK